MKTIDASELKTIMHSKRANLYYLEHCRILLNGGRVEYVTAEGRESQYWNIPIANTTTILLGPGTSLTQAAMRELAKAGVMVGFGGGGGTPLFATTERNEDIVWLSPQSEYRPTVYLQKWVQFWFQDALRLEAAKLLQLARLERVETQWCDTTHLRDQQFKFDESGFRQLLSESRTSIAAAADIVNLLTAEGRLTKKLYRLAATATGYGEFSRTSRGEHADVANVFLDHGNYLAYGLGATATWVLGLPHGLAVLHGKTRRGGLVFDVADLIKDAVVLPLAFIAAMRGDSEQQFRQSCIEAFIRTEALGFMIDTLEATALSVGERATLQRAELGPHNQ